MDFPQALGYYKMNNNSDNNNNEIPLKWEPLLYTRTQHAVQENKKIAFKVGQVEKQQANPRTVSQADTSYITHTYNLGLNTILLPPPIQYKNKSLVFCQLDSCGRKRAQDRHPEVGL